jgi:hypothetical protein
MDGCQRRGKGFAGRRADGRHLFLFFCLVPLRLLLLLLLASTGVSGCCVIDDGRFCLRFFSFVVFLFSS